MRGLRSRFWGPLFAAGFAWEPAPTFAAALGPIMPLGDSITEGAGAYGGYRDPLYTLLNADGHTFQFVGSMTTMWTNLLVATGNDHHEGHGGYGIADFPATIGYNIGTWIGPGGAAPDYILLMIGTNDLLRGGIYEAPDRLDRLITQISHPITGLRPNAQLIVASIPQIDGQAWLQEHVQIYNASVLATVQAHAARGEKVTYINNFDRLTVADLGDGLHPNQTGYNKLATGWRDALTSLQAGSRYWDTNDSAPGIGGSGVWAPVHPAHWSEVTTGDVRTLNWNQPQSSALFGGTPGTVTLAADLGTSGIVVLTSGYRFITDGTAPRSVTGTIALEPGVTFTLGDGASGGMTIGTGGVMGGAGATLVLQTANSGSAPTRWNFGGASLAVPVSIAGSGPAHFVGVGGAAEVSGSLTGNGGALSLGAASSGDMVNFSGAIQNGTGPLRIAAGAAGGAGTLLFSGIGNAWGDTELANDATGIVRLGRTDALPVTTRLRFGAQSGFGHSTFDLAGFDQTLGQLTSGPQSGGSIVNSFVGTLSRLFLQGSDSGSPAFSGSIGDGAGTLALTRGGTGSTTLTGQNTFSGSTTISGGRLVAAAHGALGSGATGTSSIVIGAGGTLALSGTAGDRVRNDAPIAITGGTLLFANTSTSAHTSELLGTLTLSGNSVIDFDSTLGGGGFAASFAGLSLPGSGAALVLNWNGSLNQAPGASSDRLLFASGVSDGYVSHALVFNLDGMLYNTRFRQSGPMFEAIPYEPVPEPAAIGGAAALLALVGWRERRRLRQVVSSSTRKNRENHSTARS